MRKVLKWAGIVVGSLVGLVLVAVLAGLVRGNHRLNATYTAPDSLVTGFGDSVSLARGEHIMRIHSCQFCHGDKLDGKPFLDIPPAKVVASNLMSGYLTALN